MNTKETTEGLATDRLSFMDYADQVRQAQLTALTLDVGRTCSLTCAGMCYREERKQPTQADEYVSMNLVTQEVRLAEIEGLRNLTVSGTEPFLHLDQDAESTRLATSRTYDILHELGSQPRSYRLGLVSNGLDIHRHWDQLTSFARDGHFNYMDLSIDSGDPAAHDRIRGRKGAGTAVLAALREANRRLEGVRVSTASVLRSSNAAGILQLIEEQAPHNKHFFITPVQPPSMSKGVSPINAQTVIQFIHDVQALLERLRTQSVEVTILITGLYIYDLMQAGIFSWDEVEDAGELSVTRFIHSNILRIELAILPAYGNNLGLLEFTGDYLPHAHALQLPRGNRGEWVAGNIRDTPLLELHRRGTHGIMQKLLQARDNHDCRDQPCWNTCFGGLAFNMEDNALQGRALTEKPTACTKADAKRRLIVIP